MTAKKLTDDEIVKRLELCVHRGNKNYNTDLVLDLINRQQAEIESLKKVVIDDYATEYDDKIKSEAIKEFAERLKNKLINTPFSVCCTGESEDYTDGVLRGLVAKQNNVIDIINDLLK